MFKQNNKIDQGKFRFRYFPTLLNLKNIHHCDINLCDTPGRVLNN